MSEHSAELAALSREDIGHRTTLALVAGGMGTFEWNLETDIVECDTMLRKLWGLPKGRILGKHVFAVVHPDDLPRLEIEMQATLAGDKDYDTSFRVNLPDGATIWIGGRGRVVERRPDGAPVRMLGVNWDMTHAKDQEERLTHLVREMNHRVNNAFALMESMLVLGTEFPHDVQSFSDMMCTQIHALADAHQLAADFFLHRSTNSETVPMEIVLDKVLRIWLKGPLADRIELKMPEGLSILSKDITPLSMILYELATNAVKYSVLGAKPGRLKVQAERIDENWARLTWHEQIDTTDAPDHDFAAITANEGLGTLLLAHCLEKISAKVVTRELDSSGLRYDFRFRMRRQEP
jgi:PAS domain S-box-containing protein